MTEWRPMPEIVQPNGVTTSPTAQTVYYMKEKKPPVPPDSTALSVNALHCNYKVNGAPWRCSA